MVVDLITTIKQWIYLGVDAIILLDLYVVSHGRQLEDQNGGNAKEICSDEEINQNYSLESNYCQ